ncbi:putative protein kinase RLK-Pelle-DLSV family [Helianthus annuus]|nr:putative protein kinase RLK-Pelle-DLSV family [Helianthus annuus]
MELAGRGKSVKSLELYLHAVGGEDRILNCFDFNTIVNATANFSEANMLSSDYYKFIYKGRLQNGQDITITHYSLYAPNIYKECMNEASILVKLEHENVIQLLGYCIHGTEVYLVYDFALNATLDSLIFDPMCNILDWNKRYKIILGVARALVYLHNHAPIRIIHGDAKLAKVLVDESFDPKLSGFGYAMTINDTDCIYVDSIRGTP